MFDDGVRDGSEARKECVERNVEMNFFFGQNNEGVIIELSEIFGDAKACGKACHKMFATYARKYW
eukprot:15365448-Ditylum_brightwellii.AAC.2